MGHDTEGKTTPTVLRKSAHDDQFELDADFGIAIRAGLRLGLFNIYEEMDQVLEDITNLI